MNLNSWPIPDLVVLCATTLNSVFKIQTVTKRKRKHRGNVYFPITHQYHWSVINYANHSLNASVQFWIIGKGFEAEKIILPQHQNLDYQISIDVVPFEKLLADCKSLLM